MLIHCNLVTKLKKENKNSKQEHKTWLAKTNHKQNRLTTFLIDINLDRHQKCTICLHLTTSISLLLIFQFLPVISLHSITRLTFKYVIHIIVHNLFHVFFLGIPLCLVPSTSKVIYFYSIIIILS